jgi:hypothetical protein
MECTPSVAARAYTSLVEAQLVDVTAQARGVSDATMAALDNAAALVDPGAVR